MTPPSPSRPDGGMSEGGDGPPVQAGGPGWLVLWLAKPLRLVLDVNGYLLQRRQVLPAVMRAEEQLTRVREQDADVRLRAATIAQIESGQRLSGGDSSSHVAFLVSCLRLLRPAGSGLLGCAVAAAPVGLTLGTLGGPRAVSGGGQLPYSTAQHIPRRQASRCRAVYATSENRTSHAARPGMGMRGHR